MTAPAQAPPTPEEVAQAHADAQAVIRAMALAAALQAWADAPPDVTELLDWWFGDGRDQVFTATALAQEMMASEASDYVRDSLALQGIEADVGDVVPEAFAAVASDGTDLAEMLDRVPLRVWRDVEVEGKTPAEAYAAGESMLRTIVWQQTTDAGREADQVAIVGSEVTGFLTPQEVEQYVSTTPVREQRPEPPGGFDERIADQRAAREQASLSRREKEERLAERKKRRPAPIGWIRMLTPPSCGRCAILAGKWYGWNDGFERHPNCFPAGVVVSGPAPAAHTRRWYEGQLVVLRTASGKKLPATANHPVLTDRGWVPAKLLAPGDHVVSSLSAQATPLHVPDQQQVPARIEDLWAAASVVGPLRQVPLAPEDFHGDGGHAEIDAVALDGLLRHWAQVAQPLGEPGFTGRAVSTLGLPGERSALEALLVMGGAAPGGVRSGSLAGAVLCGHLAGAHQPRRRAPADRRAAFLEMSAHDGAAHAELHRQHQLARAGGVAVQERSGVQRELAPRWDAPAVPLTVQSAGAYAARGKDLHLRLAGQVALDRVIEVQRVEWSGHVYNLTSSEGWFSANGIIASNCDCRHIPALEADGMEMTTNPLAYFFSLSREEQDDYFGAGPAEAIRNGADVSSVINAQNSKSGVYTADGRQYTREGTTRRGSYGRSATGRRKVPRPTPLQIYRDSRGDREEARRLLREFGYLVE